MPSITISNKVEIELFDKDIDELKKEFYKLEEFGIHLPITHHWINRHTIFPILTTIFYACFSLDRTNKYSEKSELKKEIEYIQKNLLQYSRQLDYLQKALDSKKAYPNEESDDKIDEKQIQLQKEIKSKLKSIFYQYKSHFMRDENKRKDIRFIEWLEKELEENKLVFKILDDDLLK